ncbi:MAG: site-specific DNA-methyltransferase [Planctomycetia bacterium]|nr:site-specific DNA-methyltransferase [Planctomycetia bacterium]
MKNNPLPRLDASPELRDRLLPHCRLKAGELWQDPEGKHRVGCLDATDATLVAALVSGSSPTLAIQDPPYNLVAFERRSTEEYIDWSRRWIRITYDVLAKNASLYVWLGADQNDGFQPLADFMVMMRQEPFASRSFITMRNQRGYGTQKNWMAVRQELLYYTKGCPAFKIEAEYTDIPKILRGYYKEVKSVVTENLERSKSHTIRAGNVWVDIQQVFYRMEENVSGCYAQKPLKSVERIVRASSNKNDAIVDLFAHSGSTLLAAEILGRRCFSADVDPVFCEITIRRLEHYRRTGRLGWQNGHPFENEMPEPFQSANGEAPLPSRMPSPQPTLFG